MAISIVIVDDLRLFRQTLRYFLERDPEIIIAGEAQDGQDAVLLCKKARPDIVLMDVAMPRMDGIAATKLLRSVSPSTKVLMLSMYDDDERIQFALEAGAVGFILKDASCDEFLQIIKSAHSGDYFLSPYLANLTRKRPNTDVKPKHNSEEYHFTNRETEILHLLVQGFSNANIAGKLFLSDDTVKMYLKHIFKKLEVNNRTEAAVMAIKHGLTAKS